MSTALIPPATSAADWDRYYAANGEPRLISENELRRFRGQVRPRSSWRAIDLGCGIGSWTAQLHRLGMQVTGYDYSQAAIDRALRRGANSIYAQRIDFRMWDIVADPVPADLRPGTVDLITCRASLAYLDPATLLDKVAPLLTPGGVFYALIPLNTSPSPDPYYKGMALQDIVRLGRGRWTERSRYRLGDTHRALVLRDYTA
ncbi:class I SAM-dependent methyltransferase [Streptomyces sp. enrichment culture]|uniref:class I SAM-dependent methyltransferase n=1 Tax=Streptomyces sp. enrichment culture TaxID=1795815 RepID=UPI003F55AA40